MRRVTLYRHDSTTQVVYDDVKAVFWTAANSVLVVARYADDGSHYYVHWPRERFCWFKDAPLPPTPERPPLFPEMIDYLADAMRDEPELFDDDPDTERRTPVNKLAGYSAPFPVVHATRGRIAYPLPPTQGGEQ